MHTPARQRLRSVLGLAIFIALLLMYCQSVRVNRRQIVASSEVGTLDKASKFLKAHLHSGDVYVLSEWMVDSAQDTVTGKGSRLGPNRDAIESAEFTIPISTVALFETNVIEPDFRIRSLAVMSGISAAVTLGCAASPKSCFGSCPTFYVDGDASPAAEGFSSSIAPALEARDVDALYRAGASNRTLTLRVTNEALETHVIRYADLLVAPRPPSGRVFAAEDGRFWRATRTLPPLRCQAEDGNCLDRVQQFDGVERFIATDGRDLSRKETMQLDFAAPLQARVGLVIGARQTFLSTFLLYQTLAYLGRSAVASLAALERGDRRISSGLERIGRHLRGIEVLVEERPGEWIRAGEFSEQGPISTDVHMVPLTVPADKPLRIRLRMVRGMWRIDYLALATLGEPVEPQRIVPHEVRSASGSDPSVRDRLINRSGIITMPGDEYTLIYRLPESAQDLEFFLETRGYYLEWLRQEWIAEESWFRARLFFLFPRLALRMLAPEFKKYEPVMEQAFWSSRYAKS